MDKRTVTQFATSGLTLIATVQVLKKSLEPALLTRTPCTLPTYLQATRTINVVGPCGPSKYECNGLCWDSPCDSPTTNITLLLLTLNNNPNQPTRRPPTLKMVLPAPAAVYQSFSSFALAQVQLQLLAMQQLSKRDLHSAILVTCCARDWQ
jgi:hypothetical protein